MKKRLFKGLRHDLRCMIKGHALSNPPFMVNWNYFSGGEIRQMIEIVLFTIVR